MTMNEDIRYTIALSRILVLYPAVAQLLYREFGSAQAVYENRNRLTETVPDCSQRLIELLQDWSEPLLRADEEIRYMTENNIEAIPFGSDNYPTRLHECADAPLLLYYRGNANLNVRRVISIVGTRHCTIYGEDVIRRFVADLRQLCPQVLVVSGLAYGVDIHAHQQALNNGYETVGVLAHGLDNLYPSSHRATAVKMLSQGGLLTEFLTQTNADKINFVRRNRIVAGMSDACILVESAAKGGGLITTEISQAYNRDVFAFPGRVGDVYSEGCNNLIRSNGATLITSAEDFVKDMRWQDDAKLMKAKRQGIERTLFPDLSAEEQAIVNVLEKNNDLQINLISIQSGIEIGRLTAHLFSLEMKGIVKTLAGGMYHLLK